MIEPYIREADVEAARADVFALVRRVEALLPRIKAAQGVHEEEALAKLAKLYTSLTHDLLKVGTLHDELIEHHRLLALRRALKPYVHL